MRVEFNREDAAMMKVLLLLQLVLTIGQLAHGQSTSLQVASNNRSQSSLLDSQQENNMANPLKMVRMKLLSIILDDWGRELERPSVSSSVSSTERTETKCSHSENNDAKEKVGILVQQHYVGTTFFSNHVWNDYKVGFGDVKENYWIGNERLHNLTIGGRYKLRVDLLSKYNNRWYWAEYKAFRVMDESLKYLLAIGDYSGTAGDRLQYANGMRFETRDNYASGCGANGGYGNGGGFWYNSQSCNNGVYLNSPVTDTYGFTWLYLAGTSSWSDAKLVVSRMTLLPK